MDVYTIVKFLHVLCALAWVGGGLTLLASGIMASRAKDTGAMLGGLEIMNRLGKTWFVPASLLTVVFGIVTASLGMLWGELWVILGLVGFASTFLTGLLLLEPTGRKIGTMVAAGRIDDAMAQGARLLTISKFDYTVMLMVIVDMVLKPGSGDVAVLAIMGAAVIAGAAFFLGPLLGRTPAASASA